MAITTQTALPMTGPYRLGPPRRQPLHTMTSSDNVMTLVLLGHADVRWPPLVTSAPPAKERKPPGAAWTVVARCRQRRKPNTPPLASAVEQGQQIALLHLNHTQKPPLTSAVEQAAPHATTNCPPPPTNCQRACPLLSDVKPVPGLPNTPQSCPIVVTLSSQCTHHSSPSRQ